MNQMNLLKVGLAAVLAIVPACIWGYIFYKKQVGQKSMNMLTFFAGAFFVAPLLLYKFLWQFFPWINAFAYTQNLKDDPVGFASFTLIPLEVLATFLIVGVIEELAKFAAIKFTNEGRIHSIDDAIELSITAALGFAFVENIIYFYNIMTIRGPENLLYPFIFRSLFSTFAHMMFSGILGYYYGLAHFSHELNDDKATSRLWPITKVITKIFKLRKDVGFKDIKMTEGLLIAIGLHALFNIFLEMNWTFLLVPYLTGGYILLSYLLNKKIDNKIYLTS